MNTNQATYTGQNYDIWQINKLQPCQFALMSNFDKLKYLCCLAHLAPSTHNTQPWKFSIDSHNSKVDIFLDRTKILPASDVVGRQSLISIGCALEHFVIATKYLGPKPVINLSEINKRQTRPIKNKLEDQKNIHIASLNFIPANPNDDYEKLFKSIFTRKVMRSEFDPEKEIKQEIRQEIKKITDNQNIKLHLVSDRLRRLTIAEFQAQADGYVINTKKFSKELGDWLLPNDTASFVGMPGVGFGLQDGQAIRFHQALLGEQSLEPEDGLRFSLAGKVGIEKSPLIGFLTVQKDEPDQWIEAGQILERIFLTCENHGLSLSIHAGIAEVAIINKMFAATIGTLKRIVSVFRIGYVKNEKDQSRPHSPRLPLDEILLSQKS